MCKCAYLFRWRSLLTREGASSLLWLLSSALVCSSVTVNAATLSSALAFLSLRLQTSREMLLSCVFISFLFVFALSGCVSVCPRCTVRDTGCQNLYIYYCNILDLFKETLNFIPSSQGDVVTVKQLNHHNLGTR